MKSALIRFPGSNCDRDMEYAINVITGSPPVIIEHTETDIPSDIDLILLPGGFTYGDYLRAGAIAARSPIIKSIKESYLKGVYILGICNGFQILVETGILEGSLNTNSNGKFICQEISLKVTNNNSIFTKCYDKNQIIKIPVAHMQGNFIADQETIKKLNDENRVIFTYEGFNPNGSMDNIAGITDKSGRVLGMMPHPERAVDPLTNNSTDGRNLFKSIIETTLGKMKV